MVTHTVVFQPKAGISVEQIAQLLAEACSLADAIPGIVSVTAGRQVRERSAEYSWGFVISLADKAALDGYYPHPAHRAFAEKFKALAEKITDFDIVEAE